jgi:hypothetical protein
VPRSLRRSSALSGVAFCAVLAGPIGSAHASNATIRATVNSYNAKILRDEAGVLKGQAAYKKHNVKPLIRALNREVTDLHALRAKLTAESASSPSGRKGKSDVTTGLGLIASAYTALARDLKSSRAKVPVSAAKVNAAVATDQKGRAKLKAGLKLLG